jgi:hypothetical protein
MLPRLSTFSSFSTSTFSFFYFYFSLNSPVLSSVSMLLSHFPALYGACFLVHWDVAPPFLPPMAIDPSPELVLTMY